ncbi:MAG: hypothetical protein SVT56_01995 [Chloroflexota bacterium]|jgi:hypothetical protein|nr:hypothetical protein [Chloroflexota bacterium]
MFKEILGEIPYTAELYWHLVQRNKPWQAHFKLDFLKDVLPNAVRQAESFAKSAPSGKSVFIFASLHYWIDFSTMIALALAGKGHQVTFSFLPYGSWDKPITKFDLRRQNLYARSVLSEARSVLNNQSLLDVRPFSRDLPKSLENAVEEVSVFDTQYTLQVEDISKEEELFKLRLERNREAAANARAWLVAHKPDVVIVPNGTIQEMGVVYRVARYLNIPTVTFEFGDQHERIWLAQNAEIMRHETDDLWEALGDEPLDESQLQQLQELFAAREDAKTWKNFARKWQDKPTEGGAAVREKLGLDDRPVILLATNVLGDSLTLGRQVFTKTMAEWVEGTVRYFADRQDVQLVIRVHPGEMLTHGTSMVDVVNAELGEIPDHIHLIAPEEKTNTYDVVDIADLGLVYTTTVGLEMAMRGIPVLVAGQTHYRNRGFTYDPSSWEEYTEILNSLVDNLESARLSQEQVELSWRYAYLFFFTFPQPFPWHLLNLKEDVKTRPVGYVLGEEGSEKYGKTFQYLVGQPLEWD